MFAQNINQANVHDLQNHILQSKGNIQSVNRENINNICSMFSEIFEDSADSCIDVSSNSRRKNGKKP